MRQLWFANCLNPNLVFNISTKVFHHDLAA
jgi:hypothetical protein